MIADDLVVTCTTSPLQSCHTVTDLVCDGLIVLEWNGWHAGPMKEDTYANGSCAGERVNMLRVVHWTCLHSLQLLVLL
jgi:hypothetical protein